MLKAREEWRPKVAEAMTAQYKQDLGTIRNHLKMAGSPKSAPIAVSNALSSAHTTDDWNAIYTQIILGVGLEFAANVQSNLGIDSPDVTAIKRNLAQYATLYTSYRVGKMLTSTADSLNRKIDLVLTSSDVVHMSDVDQLLASLYDTLADEGASALADYETISASNAGMFIGADTSGLTTLKTWSAVLDNKTRPWHADMDGVQVAEDEPFDVDGEQMMYPTDDSLGASGKNLFGCRCVATYSDASN